MTLPTFVPGRLKASDLQALADAIAELQTATARCGMSLRRAATQTLTDNTLTTVSFDTEDEDTDGFWAIGSPTVVTVPTGKGGTYSITAGVDNSGALSSAAAGFLQIVITTSLTGVLGIVRQPIPALNDIAAVSVNTRLAAGDSFIFQVQADMAASGTTMAWLSCYRTGL